MTCQSQVINQSVQCPWFSNGDLCDHRESMKLSMFYIQLMNTNIKSWPAPRMPPPVWLCPQVASCHSGSGHESWVLYTLHEINHKVATTCWPTIIIIIRLWLMCQCQVLQQPDDCGLITVFPPPCLLSVIISASPELNHNLLSIFTLADSRPDWECRHGNKVPNGCF